MRAQFLHFLLLFSPISLAALPQNLPIHAECALLMNAKSGKILWEKNPDQTVFPASTTKIATVFYVLMQKPNGLKERVIAQKEALVSVSPFQRRQDNYTKCPAYWLQSDGSQVGLKVGEEMSLEDLLYATMLSSGNDAANVLAQTVGEGSIERFMQNLNGFLQKIGCTKTHFTNPHGLHHPEHVTSARDMARLAQCAMYHPTFRKIVKTQSYERAKTNKQPKTVYVQTNRLLCSGRYHYPYAVGIKTGHHSQAKYTLVAAAEKDDRLLICSLMLCNDKPHTWEDAKTLFEMAFSEQKVEKELLSSGDQPFSRAVVGGKAPLTTYAEEALKISYYPSEEPTMRCLLVWDEGLDFPIKKGTKVGHVKLLADDQEVGTLSLFAKEEVKEKGLSRIVRHLKHYWIAYTGLLLVGIYFLIRRRF